ADGSAMFDRFEDARSASMQTTLTNQEFENFPSAFVDLDLGAPGDAPGMIQSLEPSDERSRPHDVLAGLSLDLSTGESVPAGSGERASAVDLEIEAGDGEL